MKKDYKLNIFIKLFALIICYFFIVLFSFTLFKMVKYNNCLLVSQGLGLTIPIILYVLFYREEKLINNIILIGVYFILLIILPFVFGRTYDYTYDGNSYHKTAIGYIKDGWNPIYEDSFDFMENNDVPKMKKKIKTDLWMDHYPKASWIVAANMYRMTGNIESGKSINLILLISVMSLVYGIAISKFKWYISVILSLFVALSPVGLAQMFTYYIDGLMGGCFLAQLLLLNMIDFKKKQDKLIWVSLCGLCAIFVNLKFTGLLCTGIISAVYYFYWIIKYRKDKNFWKYIKTITILFSIVYIIAIFFIGFSSYGRNTIEHHNPLYPIIGKDKEDIVTYMEPESFNDKNMFSKFIISMYSKSANISRGNGEPELKIPFKVYKSEKESLNIPDTRIGGFGPLYSVVFSLGIILIIYGIYLHIKNKKDIVSYLLPLLAIILSIILVGESWWARYIPQLYLLPILGALMIYNVKEDSFKIIINGIIIFMFVINFINSSYFIRVYKDIMEDNKFTREKLINMTSNANKIKYNYAELYGVEYNLRDYNVSYEISDFDDDQVIDYAYYYMIKIGKNNE